MGKDAHIDVPMSRPESESPDPVADNTTVSVHILGSDGWREERLAPGEDMGIDLPDGTRVAVVRVDD